MNKLLYYAIYSTYASVRNGLLSASEQAQP